jgi:hypothetical protein
MEELSELYSGFTSRTQPQLPDPPLQFSDFARWQRRWSAGDAANSHAWRARLREATPLFANADAGAEPTSQVAYERVHTCAFAHLRARVMRGVTLMTLLDHARFSELAQRHLVATNMAIAHRRVRSA